MEDLREVGQKAIESVGNLGASNAGDLVLGIGEIIEELREHPDQHQEKLDHLEGLFREFALGEGYELRNDRTEEPEDMLIAPNINISGYIPPSGYNFASGVYPTLGPPTIPPTPTPAQQMTGDPKNPFEELLDEEEGFVEEEVEEEPKPYEHKWWKKKV